MINDDFLIDDLPPRRSYSFRAMYMRNIGRTLQLLDMAGSSQQVKTSVKKCMWNIFHETLDGGYLMPEIEEEARRENGN